MIDNIKNDLIRVLCDSIIVKLELAGDVIEPILVVFSAVLRTRLSLPGNGRFTSYHVPDKIKLIRSIEHILFSGDCQPKNWN